MPTKMIPVLTEVTEEVFETMVFSPVKALPPCDTLPPPFGAGIIATISFSGATTNGVVSFYAPMSAARTITAAMLGLSPEELQDEVPDAIGELTNMIAGAFRTRMADDGGAWTISTPNVALGFRPLRPARRRHLPPGLPLRAGQRASVRRARADRSGPARPQ